MHKTHITAEGDTFDALALEYYNDEKLASTIIQANPDHCATLIFEAGISLIIPEATAVIYPETLPPWRREA
jgi:phage tail protein X